MRKKFLIFMLVMIMVLLIGCKKSEAVLKAEIMIDAIGSITTESGEAISAAQEAFESLSEKEKEQVSNQAVLHESILAFQKLCDETDRAAAQSVIEQIDNLTEIRLDSLNALNEINTAYEALTPTQKDLVGNYSEYVNAVTVWLEKYDFKGNTYYCKEWKVYNTDIEDITKSNSTYVSLLAEKDKVSIKVSDGFDRLIYQNQYGIYYGVLVATNAGKHNGDYMTCIVAWEEIPTVISETEITNTNITLYYNEGNAYLWFVVGGDPSKYDLYDAYVSNPNAILVYHEFAVLVN